MEIILPGIFAVLGAVLGALVAWLLNVKQHRLEIEKLNVELDRKDLYQEKERLEVDKLRTELGRKELHFEKERLEVEGLKAELEQRDLVYEKEKLEVEKLRAELGRREQNHERNRLELDKLKLELEILKKQLLQLSTDEFWQNIDRQAMRLRAETDRPRWLTLKAAYQEIAQSEESAPVEQATHEDEVLKKLMERILQKALEPYFEEIEEATTYQDRQKAVTDLKEYLEDGGLKGKYEIPDDVFEVYIEDSVSQSKFLDPNDWIAERLMNMSDLPQGLQESLCTYAFNRLRDMSDSEH